MKWYEIALVVGVVVAVFWAGAEFGTARTTVKFQSQDNAALTTQNAALAQAIQDLNNANDQTANLIAQVNAMSEDDNRGVGPILDSVMRGLYERQEARRRAR